nr:MAG TPA: hypothetical protein [Caudoviricetes sp.]DAZ07067.1 MAG TPA: hypothetical protein [Caudoviricetes sp.]DAZ51397.1 MAG TPA: hypothetical protein [Caudoviricetes sp.]
MLDRNTEPFVIGNQALYKIVNRQCKANDRYPERNTIRN